MSRRAHGRAAPVFRADADSLPNDAKKPISVGDVSAPRGRGCLFAADRCIYDAVGSTSVFGG